MRQKQENLQGLGLRHDLAITRNQVLTIVYRYRSASEEQECADCGQLIFKFNDRITFTK
jgi:hypothetical protein